jgi:hypothetical protein
VTTNARPSLCSSFRRKPGPQQRSWSSSSFLLTSFPRKRESILICARPCFLKCRASTRPAGERVTFLCLCKEKSPKETHPGGALSGHPALRVREGATGFAECTSMCMQRTGAHHARPPSDSSFAPSPRHRGPISAASCRRSNRSQFHCLIANCCEDKSALSGHALRCQSPRTALIIDECARPTTFPSQLTDATNNRSALLLLLLRQDAAQTGPPVARRAGGGKARRGARTMRARSLRAHGCALSEPRSPIANLEGRMPGRRVPGGVLSLVTFFAQAKKVTRSPAGRVEALHLKRQEEQRSWIPAFAGMTSKRTTSKRVTSKGITSTRASARSAP